MLVFAVKVVYSC